MGQYDRKKGMVAKKSGTMTVPEDDSLTLKRLLDVQGYVVKDE
jgi:hypothetical protein